MKIEISAVIATYKRPHLLEGTLAALAVQKVTDALGWEVVVVDNNSQDGTGAMVAAFAETPTPLRTLGAGARAGDVIEVEVPTHAAAVVRMRNGALATLAVSFETRGQYVSGLTVYGTGGLLTLPDANAFTGDVVLTGLDGEPAAVPYDARGPEETRGIGLDELALALAEGRPHRASGELALHVLEAAEAIVASADELRFVELDRDGAAAVSPPIGDLLA